MDRQIEILSDGSLLILFREGGKLVRVQYVAASVASYYL